MQHLYTFLGTSKTLMRLNVGFREGLQPQNVIFYETFVPLDGENYS